MKKLKWAPKTDPYKLVSLYQRYMSRNADEADVDDVGIGLYLRCHDIILIAGGKCRCPECGTEFPATDAQNHCPNTPCGFAVTEEQFRNSWRHRDLWCGNALPAFVDFHREYPRARTADEKMILIDTLIHSFHWDIKCNLPNRSASTNLLEGSLEQVIAILDRLSGVQPENDAVFQQTVKKMWDRRRNV